MGILNTFATISQDYGNGNCNHSCAYQFNDVGNPTYIG